MNNFNQVLQVLYQFIFGLGVFLCLISAGLFLVFYGCLGIEKNFGCLKNYCKYIIYKRKFEEYLKNKK